MVNRIGWLQEPPTKYKTENYCVAYLDILGGVQKIKDDIDSKFLNYLIMLYSDVYTEAEGIFNLNKEISVKIFSDNILLAIKINTDDPQRIQKIEKLLNVVSNIFNEALRYGVLMRGAVTEGELFINDTFVYGKALIDVVKMEEEIAIYPRIVIYNEISHLVPHHCKICEDGIPILNHFIFADTFEGASFKYRLLEMLKENQNNHKIKQKIMWLINYFNDFNTEQKLQGYTEYYFIKQEEINEMLKI